MIAKGMWCLFGPGPASTEIANFNTILSVESWPSFSVAYRLCGCRFCAWPLPLHPEIIMFKWFIVLNSDRPVIIDNCRRRDECRFSNVPSDSHLTSRRRTLLENLIVSHKVKNVPLLWCQTSINALTRARQCPCPKPKGNSLILSPFLFKTYFNIDQLSIYTNIPYMLYSLQSPILCIFIPRLKGLVLWKISKSV